MAKRVITVFEILIFVTLFSMFASFVITTTTNDAIIDNTEEFVELVRYKGCITDQMYYDFIDSFSTPVDVSISVERQPVLATPDTMPTLEWTKDVVLAFDTDADGDGVRDGMYKMNAGDEIEVIVRKPSGSYYDSIISRLSGNAYSVDKPVVAVKGGMILNTQWD